MEYVARVRESLLVHRPARLSVALAALAIALAFAPRSQAAPAWPAAGLTQVLSAIRAPGARAVLVNVWATWCEPCREEMPGILRYYRAHQKQGLRLVLVSADDENARADIAAALKADSAEAGFPNEPLDIVTFIKKDNDTTFINGIDPQWTGALPATFLFDAEGTRVGSWLTPVTFTDLQTVIDRHLDSHTEKPAAPPNASSSRRRPHTGKQK